MTTEHEAQRADRERAAYAAMFATDHVLISHPEIMGLPRADQSRITVEAALGYLIGHGLVTVKPESEWPEWLAIDIPEHMEPDVAGRVARRAAMPRP
jgi:hypothetical protein